MLVVEVRSSMPGGLVIIMVVMSGSPASRFGLVFEDQVKMMMFVRYVYVRYVCTH